MNEAWRTQAACHPIRKPSHLTLPEWVDLFYPGQGGDASIPLAICAGCPVQPECKAASKGEQGIWGGMPRRQRGRTETRVLCRHCGATFTRTATRGGRVTTCSPECKEAREAKSKKAYEMRARV
jgi:hypothetical protein